MSNMFSGKIKKQVPKTPQDCLTPDETVTNLHIWAERLENWGRALLIFLILFGILSTIFDTAAAIEGDQEVLPVIIASLMKWGLYAFLEYCAYHVLALIISAFASITQHNIISANVLLYESSQTYDYSEPVREDTPPITPNSVTEDAEESEIPQASPAVPAQPEDYIGVWKANTMTFSFAKDGLGTYTHRNRIYDFGWKLSNEIITISIDGIVEYSATFKLNAKKTILILIENELPASDRDVLFHKS